MAKEIIPVTAGGEQPLVRVGYKVKEVAFMLGTSEKSVRRAIERGLIHASKAFRHKLIPVSEIERFLNQR